MKRSIPGEVHPDPFPALIVALTIISLLASAWFVKAIALLIKPA